MIFYIHGHPAPDAVGQAKPSLCVGNIEPAVDSA